MPTIHPRERHILLELKGKYPHLTEMEIMQVINFQFDYTVHQITMGDRKDFNTFKSVLLNGLGTFYPSIYKYNSFKHKNTDTDEECIDILSK
jgi:hypothetical protein